MQRNWIKFYLIKEYGEFMNVERIIDWCEDIVHYWYVLDELEDVGIYDGEAVEHIKKELKYNVNGLIHLIKSEENIINE